MNSIHIGCSSVQGTLIANCEPKIKINVMEANQTCE